MEDYHPRAVSGNAADVAFIAHYGETTSGTSQIGHVPTDAMARDEPSVIYCGHLCAIPAECIFDRPAGADRLADLHRRCEHGPVAAGSRKAYRPQHWP